MRPYSRFNRGYHYILTIIDVLSKYAWAVPMKSKSGKEAVAMFARIFQESGRCPKNLQTDQGKEFYNADLQKLLKNTNDMWKMFTLNGTYKWIDSLPHLIMEYNTRKHRTIGMRPIDVTPEIADKLLHTVYNNVKIAAPARFKVGDLTTNPATYLLEDSRGKSIAGGFYEYELHRAANPDVYLVEKVLRKSGDKVLVKWLGFDNSHNSWIHKENVL
ncbi:uncharacterized protein LOC112589601 [Harpegnathos saltator]|uniref:uncharacterized protein LOC112589601 n=1 Tax=Harpegnathos saltator TaxID=610380 RepID=UPI000DBED749|nr:uncharacterized protein LOC112589601 [Harpegnathos saltator]